MDKDVLKLIEQLKDAVNSSENLSKIKITADDQPLKDVINSIIPPVETELIFENLQIGLKDLEEALFKKYEEPEKEIIISAEEARNIDLSKARIIIPMRLKAITEALEDIREYTKNMK